MRSEQFYKDYDINLRLGSRVTKLEPEAKSVQLEDGSRISYDKILLSTGSQPRRLEIPGADLENILTLRSAADAKKINQLAEEKDRVVIIGASFIGMETAASLTARDLEITVVAPESYPYEIVFGTEIGKMYKKIHEENGVNFELNSGVDSFLGQDKVRGVKLSTGEELAADFVLVGIGVRPSTDYLSEDLKDDGGAVPVDEYLKNREDIYAAGDIAQFKDSISGEPQRVEHWRVALQHGRLAGRNMVGNRTSFQSGLFFWTRQYGFSLHYVGHCEAPDEIITWGNVQERDFISFYIKNGEIRAAAGCGNGKQMGIIVELMEDDRLPEVEAIRDQSVELTEELL
ncbi:MAG: NAD(P)/FAD-dependent oxidoreductase [Bacillota bacterium]